MVVPRWERASALVARPGWHEYGPTRGAPDPSDAPEIPVPGPCILDMQPSIHTPYPWSRGPWMTGKEPPVSVRNALLALLEPGPRYGYQLRAEFEHRTGGTWPLNVGQVYTT